MTYEALQAKGPKDVFPIYYETDIPLPTGPVSGAIEGFLYLELKGDALDGILLTKT